MWKRVGKFDIPNDVIRHYPFLAKALLSEVVVVRAEAMFQSASIEYVCLSEMFEELESGVTPPPYKGTLELVLGIPAVDLRRVAHHQCATPSGLIPVAKLVGFQRQARSDGILDSTYRWNGEESLRSKLGLPSVFRIGHDFVGELYAPVSK